MWVQVSESGAVDLVYVIRWEEWACCGDILCFSNLSDFILWTRIPNATLLIQRALFLEVLSVQRVGFIFIFKFQLYVTNVSAQLLWYLLLLMRHLIDVN